MIIRTALEEDGEASLGGSLLILGGHRAEHHVGVAAGRTEDGLLESLL